MATPTHWIFYYMYRRYFICIILHKRMVIIYVPIQDTFFLSLLLFYCCQTKIFQSIFKKDLMHIAHKIVSHQAIKKIKGSHSHRPVTPDFQMSENNYCNSALISLQVLRPGLAKGNLRVLDGYLNFWSKDPSYFEQHGFPYIQSDVDFVSCPIWNVVIFSFFSFSNTLRMYDL